MSPAPVLVRLLHDPEQPASFSARARERRWQRFRSAFPDLAEMKVLDLGGRPDFWRKADVHPASVTVVNLEEHATDEPWLRSVVGDVCELPPDLRSESFDLVFSNSLLEHLGGPANRFRCAEVVHEMADRHWVQTPYRYFPVEPHWLLPGFQFLPLAARASITRRWPVRRVPGPDKAAAVISAAGVDLVSLTEMRAAFPTSEIWCERAAGLVKSLVAIRSGP